VAPEPDPAWHWAYDGIAQVMAADCLDLFGDTDLARTGDELRVHRAGLPAQDSQWAVAVGDTGVLGYVLVSLPLAANLDQAVIEIVVHPRHRRRGVGTTLADWAEHIAAASGRASWLTWATYATAPRGTPTRTLPGSDPVPADLAGLAFGQARGYTLRQIERYSRLEIGLGGVVSGGRGALADGSVAGLAEGYRLHHWLGVPPEDRLPEVAGLTSALTEDAPAGQVTQAPDQWDAERFRRDVERVDRLGRDTLTTAAVWVPTGEVVAYTDLFVPRAGQAIAEQDDTIVRRDHRGHGLGLAIKAANLAWMVADYPHVRRVVTWNASENAPMLAVNTALGFSPVGGAAWLQQGDHAR
jgi:GNAT superfamily N-acetyltransferase